jgi:hypothetical protein
MSLDFDNANRARDARLRYAVLVTVDSNKHTGYALTGRTIRDIHDGIHRAEPSEQFEDDAHVVAIMKDLAAGDYIRLTDTRTHKTQKLGPSFLQAEITIRGTRFLAGGEPPDSLIDDGRIVPGKS